MNDKTRTKKTGIKRGLLKGENMSSIYWRDNQIPITGMGKPAPITKLRKKEGLTTHW